MNSTTDFASTDEMLELLVNQIQTNSMPNTRLDSTPSSPGDLSQDKDTDKQNIPKKSIKGQCTQKLKNDFYEVTIPSYTPDEFRCFFRMSRRCFTLMMENLSKKVKIYNMDKKLLFTIWMLSTRESFCAVGTRFGFAKGAAYQYFCEMIDGLIVLFKQLVHWPADTEFSHIEQGFKPKTGGYVPGIIGAINGCHIQIKKPSRNSIYCNRRNTHSIILQAVCDHQKIFTDVYVGAPGCLQPERVFFNSPLSREIQKLIPDDYHIVGNSSYPQLKNLVVPLTDAELLTDTQMLFNDCLEKAISHIELAFRLLLSRFRRLTYLDTSKPELANKMVCACVILHNHILTTDLEDDVDLLLEEELELFLNDDPETPRLKDEDLEGTMKRNYLLSMFDFI